MMIKEWINDGPSLIVLDASLIIATMALERMLKIVSVAPSIFDTLKSDRVTEPLDWQASRQWPTP